MKYFNFKYFCESKTNFESSIRKLKDRENYISLIMPRLQSLDVCASWGLPAEFGFEKFLINNGFRPKKWIIFAHDYNPNVIVTHGLPFRKLCESNGIMCEIWYKGLDIKKVARGFPNSMEYDKLTYPDEQEYKSVKTESILGHHNLNGIDIIDYDTTSNFWDHRTTIPFLANFYNGRGFIHCVFILFTPRGTFDYFDFTIPELLGSLEFLSKNCPVNINPEEIDLSMFSNYKLLGNHVSRKQQKYYQKLYFVFRANQITYRISEMIKVTPIYSNIYPAKSSASVMYSGIFT